MNLRSVVRPSVCTIALAGLCLPWYSFAGSDLSNLAFHPIPLEQAALLQMPAPGNPPLSTATDILPVPAGAGELDSIPKYLAAIAELQATQGPYHESLSEYSLALGTLLQEQGELAGALEAFESSLHVLRVNKGLFNLEQVPVLKAIINTHVELGDIESAHAMQEALFNLQRKHHGADTMALVPAQIEWADWNVNLYLLEDDAIIPHGESMAQVVANLDDPRLRTAYTQYTSALVTLQNQATITDERLVPTERKLAALNFMINRKMLDTFGDAASYGSSNRDFVMPGQVLEQANSAHFFDGSSALRRAIAYSYSVPEPQYDYIAARMMELGDWYLLFDRRAAALDIYADALNVMLAASLPEEEVQRIMSPGMPVQEPDATYLAEPEQVEHFAGFIDVEFELSKYGMAMNPQIIASSTEDRQIERELMHTIRSCKFRPKFVAGAAVNEEKIRLRYYYTL